MIPANVKIIGIAVAAVALFSAGWEVRGWRCAAARAAEIQAALNARLQQEKAANEHSARAEDKLATINKDDLALKRSIPHETRKDPYRCPVPADGMRLFNAARTGRAAAGEPDGSVP
jgi:hypothetical protein